MLGEGGRAGEVYGECQDFLLSFAMNLKLLQNQSVIRTAAAMVSNEKDPIAGLGENYTAYILAAVALQALMPQE